LWPHPAHPIAARGLHDAVVDDRQLGEAAPGSRIHTDAGDRPQNTWSNRQKAVGWMYNESTGSTSHTGFHAGVISGDHEKPGCRRAARGQVRIMTTLDRTAPRDLAAELPARLSLTPKTTLAGQLDGSWWPYSRSLEAELPLLAAALDEVWGRITRVIVNPTRWPVIPRKVPVAGHTVHVGWFTEQHPDKVILLSYTVGRWDLLVIPPETEPAAAARLMAAAAIPGSVLTAEALMADEAVIERGIRDTQRRETAWESEGGACMSPFGGPIAGRVLPLPGNAGR
jgi:hypothetical protein